MARSFNGSSDYAENSSPPVFAAPLTLAAWVYSANVTTSQDVISLSNSGAAGTYWRLNLGGATAGDPVRALSDVAGAGAAVAATTAGYTAGVWHHVCAVFTSATSRAVYLNGSNKGTNTTSKTPTGITRINVGSHIQSSGGRQAYFDGAIAVPCVWNAALSEAEVVQLAAALHPSLMQPGAIIDWWALAGASPEPGAVGGHDLTLNGTSYSADPPLNYGGNSRYYQQQQAAVVA